MKKFIRILQNEKKLYHFVWLLLSLATVLTSCKKYLDAKPDKKTAIANTLQDAQALLDNYMLFNNFYPSIGDQSDDNFFMNDARYNALDLVGRNNYSWAQDAINDYDWSEMYPLILNATISLETVSRIPKDSANANQWNSIKGAALFYRGYALFQVAQYYAGIYDSTTAAQKPGIPLRLSSDATIVSTRTSLAETWEHIADNFKQAAVLLPLNSGIASRPTSAAAWAALARTYLIMNRFSLAAVAADSCLNTNHTLIDFNTLDTTATLPFTRFNKEVIFPSTEVFVSQLGVTAYTIDTLLYASYQYNDLRRSIYFTKNGFGGYGFKANYDGSIYSGPFNGIAVDEIMLIKAECLARNGFINEAMATLNNLLKTRWRTGTFIPFAAGNPDQALEVILQERRKELILRGTRWLDLRRLGKEPGLAIEPIRIINGTNYILPPRSNRYTFLIPKQVIDLTGMQQNIR